MDQTIGPGFNKDARCKNRQRKVITHQKKKNFKRKDEHLGACVCVLS